MLSSRLVRLPFNKGNCFRYIKPNNIRVISTSDKNSEATTVAPSASASTECKTEPLAKSKPWQSYGFSDVDPAEDRLHMHVSFFFGITMCLVFASFFVAYAPNSLDWEQREAFLELRRREEGGLPLVDANYVDPALMVLPSDEELGDADVII